MPCPYAVGDIQNRNLWFQAPSTREVAHLRRNVLNKAVLKTLQASTASRRFWSARKLLHYVKASLRIKSIRDMKLSKIDWAQRLHEEELIDDSTLQVIRDSLTCPYDVLRNARIKLGCVMMAAFREHFATLSVEDVFLHSYIYGSPQKRGLGLYASTMAVLV